LLLAESAVKKLVLATAIRAIPKQAKRLGSYGNVMLKMRTPPASSRRPPFVIAVIRTPLERLTTPGPMLQSLNLDGLPAALALPRKSTLWKFYLRLRHGRCAVGWHVSAFLLTGLLSSD
jgi:hypothetical protein